jgi:restriction endonuclease Mrr
MGAIREFLEALTATSDKRPLVTTSGFTPSAIETAQYLSTRIMLIDATSSPN